MAREEAKGVSLLSSDATEGGLYQGGKATLTFEFVERFEYKRKVGKSTVATVLLTTFEDENGEKHEEPYGVGQSAWGVSKDGGRLIPKAGQTGLGSTTDTMKYMLKPLEQGLKDAKIELPEDYVNMGDVTSLNGLVAVVRRVPVDRDGQIGAAPKKDAQGRSFTPTKLVIQTVESAPWDAASTKKAGGSKSKARQTEEEEEEKPAARGKAKKPADDDDVKEEAIEAIVTALEDADENQIKSSKLEGILAKQLKGNKALDAIIEWATNDDNLELEKGWLFDGKLLTLDK
jgi:hypothetical protein